jgi:ribonuclease HI
MAKEKDTDFVELYTDGACLGNPGPGGWAYILRHPASGKVREAYGGDLKTTNNRMELTAVIKGLGALKRPTRVKLVSDSNYVVQGLCEWMHKWHKNGWRKKPNSAEKVPNAELWEQAYTAYMKHTVQPTWVRGHTGHPENERCDQLATAEALRQKEGTAEPDPEPTESKW